MGKNVLMNINKLVTISVKKMKKENKRLTDQEELQQKIDKIIEDAIINHRTTDFQKLEARIDQESADHQKLVNRIDQESNDLKKLKIRIDEDFIDCQRLEKETADLKINLLDFMKK